MKFTVAIVVESVNDYVRESLKHLLEMRFNDFEILLLLSQITSETFPKTRIISRPDLAGNPSLRRDLVITEARGELVAFLDDDAYPSSNWLENSLPHFTDLKVAAVGGPGVTPPGDDWKRQVSGWVHTSPVGAGSFSFRTKADKARQVDDFPSMNLIVRKSDFIIIGGFDSNFWPGEDTKLCLDLTYKLNKKIIYEPGVLVYHHRRPIFRPHLIQVGRYGLHRGYFAKVLPKTSRRVVYFLPSLLLLTFFVGGIISIISRSVRCPPSLPFVGAGQFLVVSCPVVAPFYLLLISTYFVLIFLNGLWIWRASKSFRVGFWSIPAVCATHFWYGLQFIRGITSKNLKKYNNFSNSVKSVKKYNQ